VTRCAARTAVAFELRFGVITGLCRVTCAFIPAEVHRVQRRSPPALMDERFARLTSTRQRELSSDPACFGHGLSHEGTGKLNRHTLRRVAEVGQGAAPFRGLQRGTALRRSGWPWSSGWQRRTGHL
jgi:hypothetical protein